VVDFRLNNLPVALALALALAPAPAPAFFYKVIGLIPFNILGGTPILFGSFWLAEGIDATSSSVFLFTIGKLILKFFGTS